MLHPIARGGAPGRVNRPLIAALSGHGLLPLVLRRDRAIPALELCLISACITSLKPFLQPVHSGYLVNSAGVPASSFRSGMRAKSQDSYYMLSTVKESDRDGTLVSPNEFGRAKVAKSVGDDGKLRGHVSIAIAPGGREEIETKTPRISSGRQSLESDERPMVITRTRMFTVAEVKV